MSRRLYDQESPETEGHPRGSMPILSRARHSTSLSAVLVAAFALFSLSACDDEKAEVAPPPAAAPSPAPMDDLSYDPLVLTLTAVDIDTRLAVMCGLDQSKVFFKFDSAKLLPSAKEHLEQIATCSKTGPIKGQKLLVVGRTDPVGTDEYNKLLGMSRADAVARYLGEAGVDPAQIVSESKGEATAEEKYPGNWPYDRRVSVRLLPLPGTESSGG